MNTSRRILAAVLITLLGATSVRAEIVTIDLYLLNPTDASFTLLPSVAGSGSFTYDTNTPFDPSFINAYTENQLIAFNFNITGIPGTSGPTQIVDLNRIQSGDPGSRILINADPQTRLPLTFDMYLTEGTPLINSPGSNGGILYELGTVSIALNWNYSFTPPPDNDSDGVPDYQDNCANIANSAQIDSDGDGFGNRCDADLNNDCVINAIDLGIFKSRFFSTDPDADFNSDGVVNVIDLGIMKLLFFGPPGPNGSGTCP